MKTQEQFIAQALSIPGDGFKHKNGIITDEAGAMEWAANKAAEMRRDASASPIRWVRVRRWYDRPVWDPKQDKLVYLYPPIFEALA
ncbi:hypothetical protein [Mycobacterium sp. URHB0021]